MSLRLSVSSLSGAICEIEAERDWLGSELKLRIQSLTEVAATSQRLLFPSGELADQAPLSSVLDAAAAGGDGEENVLEVMMLTRGVYDGRYYVTVKWNGPRTVDIIGGVARTEFGEFPITWDTDEPRQCSFTDAHDGTSMWAKRHTGGRHTEKDGLQEEYDIIFKGDDAASGFSGTFKRSFEGPLPMTGRLKPDEDEAQSG
eukprot:TRINITY_DN23107_c0_g2_i1.p1 TRINITY_DN23107_c0_g2~~TRINITY_DN23107_c0_g2_i1.p1  ORF type:complete len:201 (+),score=40.39 TRINITY_DN23107_c0_g2_i1:81-683(+)